MGRVLVWRWSEPAIRDALWENASETSAPPPAESIKNDRPQKRDGQMRSLTATTALKGPHFSVIATSLGRTADAPDFGLSTHQRDTIIA